MLSEVIKLHTIINASVLIQVCRIYPKFGTNVTMLIAQPHMYVT